MTSLVKVIRTCVLLLLHTSDKKEKLEVFIAGVNPYTNLSNTKDTLEEPTNGMLDCQYFISLWEMDIVWTAKVPLSD